MKVLIAGDFAPRERLADQIERGAFEEIFPENIRELIKSVDYSLINLECPVAGDGLKPISKYGPNLRCSEATMTAINFAGFSAVTLANNHIFDYGKEGLCKTIECCKEHGIDVIGVGENLSEANQNHYVVVKDNKLAIINCCEHEFSIATDDMPGANPLNPISQYYAIQQAKLFADYVIVIVHGGHEYWPLPSTRMQDLYRFFIDCGADAVVNHHQHCYSGYEVYNEKPIFYGLGNFCFDNQSKRHSSWNEGYMLQLDLSKRGIVYELYPYRQYDDIPGVRFLGREQKDIFSQSVDKLNAIIVDKNRLKQETNEYYNKCVIHELSLLEPYRGRVCNKMFNMGLLPKFVSGAKVPMILNHVDCESHRDKLIYALTKINR